MRLRRQLTKGLAAMLCVAGAAAAQTPAPPQAGGPPPGRAATVGRDAGPANHPPRTDSPQAVHRGTDGSAVGLDADREGTGTTPQGMLGSATAGARDPAAPVGDPPPTGTTAPPR